MMMNSVFIVKTKGTASGDQIHDSEARQDRMFRLVTSRLYAGRDEPAQIVIVFSVLSYSCLLAKLALVDSDGGRDEVPRCKQVLHPFTEFRTGARVSCSTKRRGGNVNVERHEPASIVIDVGHLACLVDSAGLRLDE